jgi:phosphatidylserine/phosphatidylglycerophosphate/cardiolipin synthase-like enzyme
MHNKFIIRDSKCVLTGSFNFTDNAVYNNRENFIIICDKEIAKAYQQEFNKILQNNTK